MNENDLHHGERATPETFLKADAPQHLEIAGVAAFQPAVWVEKNPVTGFKTYPIRNQQTQEDCTAYTLAKALSIDERYENGEWRELSPRSIYAYHFIPGGGGGADSLAQAQDACEKGLTLEYLLPTDGLTEVQAESDQGYTRDAKVIATVYAPTQIVQINTDFETIASILQAYQQQGVNKGVQITIIGQNNGSWTSPMVNPPSTTNTNPLWYHKVCVTDFGLVNGQKVLSFDNSWGTAIGNNGQQFLQESYQPYMYGGFYTLNQPDDWMTSTAAANVVKPTYTWSTVLTTGSSGPDVLALQQALQSLGMFPISNVVAPSGYFYGITKASVIEFQASFGLPQSGIVDTATMAELNKIFGASVA